MSSSTAVMPAAFVTEREQVSQEIRALRDQLQRENISLKEEIDQASMFEEIVGSSPPLRRVLGHIAKVAPTNSTVLIEGETGTGKELVARAIHKRSTRSGRAFIRVNCGAIPQSLIGSELFGHEKGAFTGATQRRAGRFELADGGTLFLDEVGELPLETQVALLRVLQEREFERIGGSKPVTVDVRIVAATNRNLRAAVSHKAFREDLFYRLNVLTLLVPPLRDRPEDIAPLAYHFLRSAQRDFSREVQGFTAAAMTALCSYRWPGNVRELMSMVRRALPSLSLRSKPALNAFAPPVSTTTEVSPSSSKLRAALVSWRSASGDSALIPLPRSNRTTAMRPSGPRPFSIVTKSPTCHLPARHFPKR